MVDISKILGYVEGKPVYAGNVLWDKENKCWMTITEDFLCINHAFSWDTPSTEKDYSELEKFGFKEHSIDFSDVDTKAKEALLNFIRQYNEAKLKSTSTN